LFVYDKFIKRKFRWWGNIEGKGQIWRPRRRWLDNINLELQEMGYGGMDWIQLTQNRDRWLALLNAVINFWFHKILVIPLLG